MSARHMLSLFDLAPEILTRLVSPSLDFLLETAKSKLLDNRVVGIFFRRFSTRTARLLRSGRRG